MPNLGYRKNVAAFILNEDNNLFLGERFDVKNSWQTVQGGVDEGKTIIEALEQEILEEIGLKPDQYTVSLCTSQAYKYTYPEDCDAYFKKIGWLGQEQFFHLIHVNNDAPIDIEYDHREFQSWKWGSVDELINGLVDFKKPAYESALRDFHLI